MKNAEMNRNAPDFVVITTSDKILHHGDYDSCFDFCLKHGLDPDGFMFTPSKEDLRKIKATSRSKQ